MPSAPLRGRAGGPLPSPGARPAGRGRLSRTRAGTHPKERLEPQTALRRRRPARGPAAAPRPARPAPRLRARPALAPSRPPALPHAPRTGPVRPSCSLGAARGPVGRFETQMQTRKS